jgi:hypothetical protein
MLRVSIAATVSTPRSVSWFSAQVVVVVVVRQEKKELKQSGRSRRTNKRRTEA